MGEEKDIPPGEKLVACFRPFLEALAASDLSPKVIQKHVDNLWSLGGEIIRNLNETPSLRRQSIERILADRIDDEGGPLVYALESEESLQRSLDSTCRKLHSFLSLSRPDWLHYPQISPTRLLSQRRGFMQIADDFPAQCPHVIDMLLNGLRRQSRRG